MVALDSADSAVVAVVPPVSVESGWSAGSPLSLALVLPAVGSTVEAVSLDSLVMKSLPEAVFLVMLSLLEVVSPSVATVLGIHCLSAAILDLFLELFSIFHCPFHEAFCLSFVMICPFLAAAVSAGELDRCLIVVHPVFAECSLCTPWTP